MIRNFLLIAWRNVTRNKTFSFVNIAGLALGLCCALFIMLWVGDEKSVDRFHINRDKLFQVYERNYHDGKVDASYTTQGLLAQELKRAIPAIEYSSGFEAVAPSMFQLNDKTIKLEGRYASDDFFRMFSYPIVAGEKNGGLTTIDAVAISKKMAIQFFGSADQAVGKTLVVDDKEPLSVKAVFDDVPPNSSVKFEWVRSWVAFIRDNKWVNNWSNTSPETFIQLKANADPVSTESQIKDFIYRYAQKDAGNKTELALQPYSERYLHSVFKNGYIAGGRVEYTRLFTAVAVIILLIACINFMNLATARATKRAKEIGVRKVIGALRSTLIKQFTGEALLLTFFAFVLAVLMTLLLLPYFNGITGKSVSLPYTKLKFWLKLIGLMLCTGFVAGSYPAFFLSALKPVRVLKGSLKFGSRTLAFRKGLVVLQFTLTIVMIVGMIVIHRQMQFTRDANLGYNRENLVYLPIEGGLLNNYQLFKQKAENSTGILSVSKMRNTPTFIEHHTGSIEWPGKDQNLTISFADAVVGYDFVKTLKLQLRDGRDFSKQFISDSAAYLINETAAQRMGYADPVGKTVYWGNRPGVIIGVLKDFHFNSFHQTIDPLIVRLNEGQQWGTILVRIQAGKTQQAIAGLERLVKELSPKFPFSYQFSDEEYTRLYKSEQIVSNLSNVFAILAICISCLGLFGLATFAAAQRTKEIGIRKVLGASVINVTGLLSYSFVKPVGLAMIVAFPLANFIMQRWLDGFAYKIDIEWWIFAAAAGITLVISLATVSYQSIKSALLNPIKSLKSE